MRIRPPDQTVGRARSVARAWILEYAHNLPTYRGAFFAGSTVGLPDDALLPPTSDLDVTVLCDTGNAPGKFRHDGVLLEVSHLPELGPPEQVLADYPLAPSFRTDTIVDDPTGQLRAIHRDVAAHFSDPPWIVRRRDHTFARIERNLAVLEGRAPWPERVLAWLFAIGVTCHSVLVAAQRNPTVRLRYPAAREVLDEGDYEWLIRLLVPGELDGERVGEHLDGLAGALTAVGAHGRTSYPFSADLGVDARPVVVDGSRRLVEAGLHREAMFWIVATFGRCHTVLAADAPRVERELRPAFDAALADLAAGRLDPARVRAYLPELRALTDRIIGAGSAADRR